MTWFKQHAARPAAENAVGRLGPGLAWRFSLSMCLFIGVASGCGGPFTKQSPSQQLPPGGTFILHLPGIAGDAALDHRWMKALEEGGAADRIELYDWTCNDAGVNALEAHERNRGEASRVAAMLSARCAADATGKVILTAESGGAGIAVWALERMPAGVQVDNVLLIAPAVSPDYDLSAALAHVRGKMYYSSSTGDWYTLGMCTQIFGTMDAKNTQAAGYVGFRCPKGCDPAQYAKLVELKYDSAWARWGNFGGHTGGMSVDFARWFLAPLLRHDKTGSNPVATSSDVSDTSSIRSAAKR
jgi:hypothetical protein